VVVQGESSHATKYKFDFINCILLFHLQELFTTPQ